MAPFPSNNDGSPTFAVVSTFILFVCVYVNQRETEKEGERKYLGLQYRKEVENASNAAYATGVIFLGTTNASNLYVVFFVFIYVREREREQDRWRERERERERWIYLVPTQ